MNKPNIALYKTQAKIMKALAHPTRLFIINELANKEKCVCELTNLIGADISTVSKHLSILKNAGIVDTNKKGTSIFYHLKMKCVLNFFVCINEILKNNIKEQITLVK
jgi:ArsR family transcriptional regulator